MAQKRKKNTLIQSNRGVNAYYNSESVAYQQALPAYIPEPIAPKVKVRPNNRVQQEERRIRRANRFYALKIFFAVGFVFCGCMVWMGMHAMLMKERIVIQEYKDELAVLKNENSVMMAELSEQMDLNKVKEIAETRLKMAKPQEYQVVYINVPKQSYTVQYAANQGDNEPSQGPIQKVLRILKRNG